jgi:hypothetical protein
VVLTWAAANGATSYILEYRPSPGAFTPLATINSGSTTSYLHSTFPLIATTSYDYRIRACNASGCSAAAQVAAQ